MMIGDLLKDVFLESEKSNLFISTEMRNDVLTSKRLNDVYSKFINDVNNCNLFKKQWVVFENIEPLKWGNDDNDHIFGGLSEFEDVIKKEREFLAKNLLKNNFNTPLIGICDGDKYTMSEGYIDFRELKSIVSDPYNYKAQLFIMDKNLYNYYYEKTNDNKLKEFKQPKRIHIPNEIILNFDDDVLTQNVKHIPLDNYVHTDGFTTLGGVENKFYYMTILISIKLWLEKNILAYRRFSKEFKLKGIELDVNKYIKRVD